MVKAGQYEDMEDMKEIRSLVGTGVKSMIRLESEPF